MSRYRDGDDGDEFWALDNGRWERNARAVLKSKRGRKALTEIRDALLALPEPRLIEGALCTVGGAERIPEVTGAEVDAEFGRLKAAGMWQPGHYTRDELASWMREERDGERKAVADNVDARDQGCGVCVNGALLWHRQVKAGMTAEEAFAALPALTDGGDPLTATARLAEQRAGLAFTLAYELAYRNDETFGRMTPEERHTAMLAWIGAELAGQGAVPGGN